MRLDRCDGCDHTREAHALKADGGECRHVDCGCPRFIQKVARRVHTTTRTSIRRLGGGRRLPGVGNE